MVVKKVILKKYPKNRKSLKGGEIVPLTKKGNKILSAMTKKYGAKKGKEVFYASANKGKISGVHKGKKK